MNAMFLIRSQSAFARRCVRRALPVSLLLALLVGCQSGFDRSAAEPVVAGNRELLAEIDQRGAWFHAKKTRAIWARKLETEQVVASLEGPVVGRAGDFLCRGAAGELWPQKAADLDARYVATDEVDPEGWRQYAPRPDAEGVMAAQVARPFRVRATWGLLSGKAGDYVLKKYRDRAVPDPVDVWIVDRALFEATYAPVRSAAP